MSIPPFVRIFCLHYLFFTVSSSSTIIPLGSTLDASDRNQSWSSPSSIFSLSFIPVTPFSYVVSITYSVGVTVWSASDGSNGGGALVDSAATLHLLTTGSLRLTNGSGAIVWDSATANQGVSHASLDDSGNFQLLNNKSSPIWSSFDHPTDTLVPSQNFTLGAPLKFSYKELQQSTKGLSQRLGEGGFGAVYRGTLANKMAVAVKQLEGIEQAKGITYLHEECRDCIMHCDIKPENILLDDIYTAKVSDFGLAKLMNPKDQRNLSLASIRGTRGYLAPEWLANLPITSKCDVYSYGMVLLEIVGGRRNFEVSAETNGKKFSEWAYEEFEKGNVEGIVDKKLEEVDIEQVVRAILVSFWCIQEQPSQRPTMGKVVQMLEGVINIERPPPPKVVAEGSMSLTSITLDRNVSALSTYATSTIAPSTSSFQTIEASRTETNMGKESSSLLGLEKTET
ncbi:hypothetical protein CCACVL1_03119 [Corchorus capsularis]|uniref:non-specific serine/threonine protein kinase n=1 Tax=Corchorus capsularis TaxID=210143 RepID=A0A1R3K2K6_COCAP|nr:hypothetical protein CCACVL1_03119 [Corchorus capsularis]